MCFANVEANLTTCSVGNNGNIGIDNNKIYGYHLYNSRVKILPTKLKFIPVEMTGKPKDIEVKIEIAPLCHHI